MRRVMLMIFTATSILTGGTAAMASEEAAYTVVRQDNRFELRDYASHVLAETVVEGTLEAAGSKGAEITVPLTVNVNL